LADELGTSPSAETKAVHLGILREPAAVAASARAVDSAAPTLAPLQSTARVRALRRRRWALVIGAVLALAATLGVVVAGPLNDTHESSLLQPPPNGLAALDTGSGRLLTTLSLGSRGAGLAYGDGAVWASDPVSGSVERISTTEEAVIDTIPVGIEPTAIAYGADGIWVANSGERTVSRINPATNTLVQAIGVGNGPADIAVGAGGVWVTNRLDGTVSRLDPQTGRVVRTSSVGSSPSGVATGFGSVWVTDETSGIVSR